MEKILVKSQEDLEYEYNLVMNNGDRLADLAIALCYYDEELAKKSLSIALGNICAEYKGGSSIADLMALASIHIDAINDKMDSPENKEEIIKDKKDNGENN